MSPQGTVAAGDSRIEAGTATVTTLLVDLPADTAVQRALAAFLASLDTR